MLSILIPPSLGDVSSYISCDPMLCMTLTPNLVRTASQDERCLRVLFCVMPLTFASQVMQSMVEVSQRSTMIGWPSSPSSQGGFEDECLLQQVSGQHMQWAYV